MALNLGRIVQNAVKTVQGLGAAGTCSILRPKLTVNPIGGAITGTTQTQNVPAVELSPAQRAAKGSEAWTQCKVALFLAAEDLSFAPELSDQVTWGDYTGVVVKIDKYAPNGTPIAYDVAVQ